MAVAAGHPWRCNTEERRCVQTGTGSGRQAVEIEMRDDRPQALPVRFLAGLMAAYKRSADQVMRVPARGHRGTRTGPRFRLRPPNLPRLPGSAVGSGLASVDHPAAGSPGPARRPPDPGPAGRTGRGVRGPFRLRRRHRRRHAVRRRGRRGRAAHTPAAGTAPSHWRDRPARGAPERDCRYGIGVTGRRGVGLHPALASSRRCYRRPPRESPPLNWSPRRFRVGGR